ncbi:uncharacterized protein LOC142652489 [Rhinoderma darwinii]|uniref:uncharacterized protein LOC142652489 n=1 Tax=Rhinoderma darwinii TaxID=43563 RepID=UPI003F66FBDD
MFLSGLYSGFCAVDAGLDTSREEKMPSCIIRGCGNTWKNKDRKVIMHVFPKNPSLIRRWLEQAAGHFPNIDEWVEKINEGKKCDHYRMCSKHFDNMSYHHDGEKRKLRFDALPSIFPSVSSSHAQKPSSSTNLLASNEVTDCNLDLNNTFLESRALKRKRLSKHSESTVIEATSNSLDTIFVQRKTIMVGDRIIQNIVSFDKITKDSLTLTNKKDIGINTDVFTGKKHQAIMTDSNLGKKSIGIQTMKPRCKTKGIQCDLLKDSDKISSVVSSFNLESDILSLLCKHFK